ncbi:OsmC family protein [Pelagovum pacificum]|uniref:OsmC family protein n=1 Tax=Pelagovum pacificum TaxID=2588711 RepID=A0A5C5GAJ9_9RHOB|nr:OsmC family protein [Pelagovum pacificum]QQA41375.1 OsmC family protein [Pelagovum pacificum]TNY31822.1 OsmC family protein [Pelagovum pacificum]
MIKKFGTANWQGDLKTGKGKISTETKVLDAVPYGFNTRFEGQKGSNPEELIGAAHASCFAMALSLNLGEAGLTADNIDAKSTVSLEEVDGGFAITKAHIEVTASVPGASEEQFTSAANATKTGCPVSKVLNCEITMDAKLA